MAKNEDQFSTKDILGSLIKTPLFRDPLNDLDEIKKRVNQEIDDVNYFLFKERVIIQAHYLDFLSKQQDEFKRLYEKNLLHEKELEEFFMNTFRESNIAQEKLSRQQLELLDQLRQRLDETIKLIEEKIKNLQSKILELQDKVIKIDADLAKTREGYRDRWIERFEEKIKGFYDLKYEFSINGSDGLVIKLTEKVFKDLAKMIGKELKDNNVAESDIPKYINERVTQFLSSQVFNDVNYLSGYSIEDKSKIIENILINDSFTLAANDIQSRIIKYALQDNDIVTGIKNASIKCVEKSLVNSELERDFKTLDLLNQAVEASKNYSKGFATENYDLKTSDFIKDLNNNLEDLLSKSSMADAIDSLVIESQSSLAAESAFQSALADLDTAESSAKSQLSNGEASTFNVDDFLASLNDITTAFTDNTESLTRTTIAPGLPEFQPEPAEIEESPSNSFKPGR